MHREHRPLHLRRRILLHPHPRTTGKASSLQRSEGKEELRQEEHEKERGGSTRPMSHRRVRCLLIWRSKGISATIFVRSCSATRIEIRATARNAEGSFPTNTCAFQAQINFSVFLAVLRISIRVDEHYLTNVAEIPSVLSASLNRVLTEQAGSVQ